MSTGKKTIEELAELEGTARKYVNKHFVHKKSGVIYKVTNWAVDEETQEIRLNYENYGYMPAYVIFSRPLSEFQEKFELVIETRRWLTKAEIQELNQKFGTSRNLYPDF